MKKVLLLQFLGAVTCQQYALDEIDISQFYDEQYLFDENQELIMPESPQFYILNQFLQGLSQCSYVKIKNLATQKYLSQVLNEDQSACLQVKLLDLNEQDSMTNDKFLINPIYNEFFTIEGVQNQLEVNAQKRGTDLTCTQKSEHNLQNHHSVQYKDLSPIFQMGSFKNTEDIGQDLTSESWFVQTMFPFQSSIVQNEEYLASFQNLEVPSKFLQASNNDDNVYAMIPLDSMEEIRKYAQMVPEIKLNQWEFECFNQQQKESIYYNKE